MLKKFFFLPLLLLMMFCLLASVSPAATLRRVSFTGHIPKTIPPMPRGPFEPVPPIGRPDDDFTSYYDNTNVITPAFKRVREDLYEKGWIRDAYLGWLRLAWQGDFFAMATLPAVIRVHPELEWPVPPEFWENRLIELLGEGEGAYVLGAQYIMMTDYRENGTKFAEQKAGEFFLRSALAGHHAGMIGAEKTAVLYRADRPFILPAHPVVTPIPADFYPGDTSGEARYWLARAADEGYWKACLRLAIFYDNPDVGRAYDKAKHYYIRAANNGSLPAATAIMYTKAGDKLDKKTYEVFRRKTPDYDFDKKFSEKFSEKEFYTYMTLQHLLSDFGSFSFDRELVSLAGEFGFRGHEATVAAGIAEARRIYAEWKKRYTAEQIQKAKHYAQARARLPEVMEDYAKQAKGGNVLIFGRNNSIDNLKTPYDDSNIIAPDFQWILQNLYECGQFREAYEGWLELAWQGDFFAMATLPAVSRVHPELQWPAPPEFWENRLIELLGEGEGAYVLGAQYAMMTEYKEDGTKHAEQKAGEFFLRSALTGHHAGMLGAEKTAKYRQHQPFTPPPSPVVTPIPVRFYGDDKNGEARYWLTRAADEGYWKACLWVAACYLTPKKGEPNYDSAEHYFESAARNGSYTAAIMLETRYKNRLFNRKPLCEGYYTYAPLALTLRHNGHFGDEQRKSLEKDFHEECKDMNVIDAAIRESRRLYEEGMARCATEMKQKMELYAQARARLPEVKDAYAKLINSGASSKEQ